MKKLNNICLQRGGLLLLLLVTILTSCENKIGSGIHPEFAPKDTTLSGEEQTVILKAKKNVEWAVLSFEINGEKLPIEHWEADSRITYYSFADKNPDYPFTHFKNVYRFEFEDWFVWERPNNNTIKMRFSANKDTKPRTLHFQAKNGNASDYIYIVQNVEESRDK